MFVYLSVKTKNISSFYYYFNYIFFKFNRYVLILKQLKKKKKKKITVLRSPHVNKKSKESFEYCMFSIELLLYVVDLNIFINELCKIRNNIFLDVNVKIKLLHLKLRKLKSLNHFLVKKCISSKYLKLLDIVGEINLNNLI
jgi:hypothetical protein